MELTVEFNPHANYDIFTLRSITASTYGTYGSLDTLKQGIKNACLEYIDVSVDNAEWQHTVALEKLAGLHKLKETLE